jgi:peptide/nickel transport system permease protein
MGLLTYIVRRLLLLIPVLIGVTILVFAISMMFPVTARARVYIRDLRGVGATERARVINETISRYGLLDPFYVQYFRWLGEVLQGNLGWSEADRQPVIDSLTHRFPRTLELVIITAPIIVFIGIYLGVISASHKDSIIDHITRGISIIGWSLPSFWLGILLLSLFYGYFKIPALSPGSLSSQAQSIVESSQFIRYTRLNIIDGLLNGKPWISLDALCHLILPSIVLITINIALLIRVMRSSMLEALSKPYIIAARAKGLKDKEVINKHARRNALIPTITLSGLLVAGMLTGLTITETVFGIEGLGRWAAAAALMPDMPSVLGFTLFTAIVYVISNLIVDILYAYIDPRIRLG